MSDRPRFGGKKYEYARPLKLHDLEAFAEETSDEIEAVTLFPPEDGTITEEESGEEEEDRNSDRLPGGLLVEVRLVSPAEAPKELIPRKRKNQSEISKVKRRRVWQDDLKIFDGNSGRGDSEEVTGSPGEEKTPVEWFESVFTDDIFQLIVKMSNSYALQRNHVLNLSAEELKVYVGILMCTGYLQPGNIRMYWETQPDTHNEAVSNAMRRNRFVEIHRYLHLCDNMNLPENDTFGKAREYLTELSKSFLDNFKKIPSSHISVGETIVPYYGKRGSKIYIRGKPVKIGYKLWSAATRSGYLISFEPFQGSKGFPLPEQDRYGLGLAVVLEMEKRLPSHSGPYNFYFDDFYTSFDLLSLLSEHGNGGTGTISENKLKHCPLMDTKILKKNPRGCFSYKTDGRILCIKWQGNSIINMATNCHRLEPIRKLPRIGTEDGNRLKKISVDCPAVIQKYNKYIVGVDRFEENVRDLRINFRGKKWWFPIFAFGVDSACQNAWQLMRNNSAEKITHCSFRRVIVQYYLARYANPPQKEQTKGVPVVKTVPAEVRVSKDYESHRREPCSQRRCGLCHGRTRIRCGKCQVGLHISCWYQFHSR